MQLHMNKELAISLLFIALRDSIPWWAEAYNLATAIGGDVLGSNNIIKVKCRALTPCNFDFK